MFSTCIKLSKDILPPQISRTSMHMAFYNTLALSTNPEH